MQSAVVVQLVAMEETNFILQKKKLISDRNSRAFLTQFVYFCKIFYYHLHPKDEGR